MSRLRQVDVPNVFARMRLVELLEAVGVPVSTSALRQQLEDDEPRRRCQCACGDRHTRPRRRWVAQVGPLLEQLEDAGLIERAGRGPSRVRMWRAAQGGGS